jgi:uracil phosphoribosyltransferase
MSVNVSSHPLIQHKLAVLRNAETSSHDFRAVMKEMTFYLGYEATGSLKVAPEQVKTPMGTCTASKLSESIAIIPILRAGLGMGDALLELLPRASVHHIGMYRSKNSLLPVQYYNRLPKDANCDVAYIVDPCIATSGTLHAVCSMVKKWGAKRVVVISVIASRGNFFNAVLIFH